MACFTELSPEDYASSERLSRTFAALLCGVDRGDPVAVRLAKEWCEHHHEVDRLWGEFLHDPITGPRRNSHDPEIQIHIQACWRALNEAHRALNPQPIVFAVP